ncbi:MAG: 3-isopropylmalate dehydratase small subunit [Rhodoferax sp.]|uniref:3-isopropylmalate dehydratase small subunit n=1 Tax=Rhodoferax sp. TaxID=50421 RepID=UPI00140035AD|nr:3-isopropylmalate dehydratase small subunit [Rhodoferax sp.]NDP38081.1 3-isopropylmalate dehydratase small subunit [Rhodoferax sp.]
MNNQTRIKGKAAPIPVANLDTDQIIPKQFLRRIDKAGLAEGLLFDMRFDATGQIRPEFVLNQADYADACVLVAGPNFGCGSSREHAVWSLQQYGIKAVIAPSFGEIFYSNAMNNGLLLVQISEAETQLILKDSARPETAAIDIDLETMSVRSKNCKARFSLSERHRRMFLEGMDMVGATLAMQSDIDSFAADHWQQHPWLKDVAAKTHQQLA